MRFKYLWAVAFVLIVSTAPARATYHTFRINELYSNPSGTVQFIELHEAFGFDFQNFISEAPNITSNSQSFTFLHDLPSAATANKNFILGTAAYAAIPGAPAPDYVIPANFFNPLGDALTYGTTGPDGIVDPVTFGAMPSDATKSLNRIGTFGNDFSVATNSPTNFAGATGSVPEPTGVLAVGALAAYGMRRRRHTR